LSDFRGRRKSIETMNARFFSLENPTPDEVDLYDISTSLANQSRFNGLVTTPYSVAEHALLVTRLVIEWGYPNLALPALHHDSHEAYCGDITPQLKDLIGRDRLGPIIARIDGAIAGAFNLDMRLFTHPVVKSADELALRLEARELKGSRGVGPHWGWPVAAEPIDGWQPGMDPADAAFHFRELHRDLVGAGP
jgi:uncharacterized protein